ncbi:putative transmembrane protein 244 isoform 1-T6 [Spinachia spinachia]
MLLDYCCRCFGFTLIKRHGPLSLKTTPSDTLVVLQNLLMCMVCFYSLYYVVVSLCVGLLRVHEINSLLAPFDYTTQPSWQNPKYLVGVISTEVTYLLGGLVFAWIVEEWVWDYAITVTLLHVAMTVAVMSDFPSAEHWWIALGEISTSFFPPRVSFCSAAVSICRLFLFWSRCTLLGFPKRPKTPVAMQ